MHKLRTFAIWSCFINRAAWNLNFFWLSLKELKELVSASYRTQSFSGPSESFNRPFRSSFKSFTTSFRSFPSGPSQLLQLLHNSFSNSFTTPSNRTFNLFLCVFSGPGEPQRLRLRRHLGLGAGAGGAGGAAQRAAAAPWTAAAGPAEPMALPGATSERRNLYVSLPIPIGIYRPYTCLLSNSLSNLLYLIKSYELTYIYLHLFTFNLHILILHSYSFSISNRSGILIFSWLPFSSVTERVLCLHDLLKGRASSIGCTVHRMWLYYALLLFVNQS